MIDEKRKRRLDSLNPLLISSTGRYNDFINHDIGDKLDYEEIMYLRKKHNDSTIAVGYEFQNVMRFEEKNLRENKSNVAAVNPRQPRTPSEIKKREAQQKQRLEQPTAPYQPRYAASNRVPNTMQRSKKRKPRKKYALQRAKRIAGNIVGNIANSIDENTKKVMLKVGTAILVVAIGTSTFGALFPDNEPITITPQPDTSYVDSNVAGTQDEITTEKEVDIMQVRHDAVAKYAYIYQLDYNTCWYFMQGITDNFQDPAYLYQYTLENISCKGSGQLYCDSEEELISYTMRVLAQDPGRFGLTEEQLARKTNDYKRPTTMEEYKRIIFDTCKVHGADPALIYAIIRQETGFNSENFMNSNNPGGIFFDGKIAEFNTLESGILELIHEVEKYERMGATTIEEIRDIHCPLNDKNDKQGLNYYWAPNVREFYEEIKPEFDRMEVEYQVQKGLQSTGIRH